jgi:hypothetical protein
MAAVVRVGKALAKARATAAPHECPTMTTFDHPMVSMRAAMSEAQVATEKSAVTSASLSP